MRKIIDQFPSHDVVHLKIGEGNVYTRPTVVRTVLGSCVSVAFHCKQKNIGAIFHAIMPAMPEKEIYLPNKKHYKYVDTAIHHIIRSLHRRGIKQRQVTAKVFGGAQAMCQGDLKPGISNIQVALEVLDQHNIQIVASDVGGDKGRNLFFITNTGEVFVKTHKNNLFEHNRQYRASNLLA